MRLIAPLLLLFLTAQAGFGQSTEGLASYYADRFHKKPTSTGETHDKDGFMAASKEYPYGTILEVTNAVSGEQVRVRVNDCGPHHPDRVLDLSRAAARRIGIVKAGVAMVKIRVVEESFAGPTCHRKAWARALKAKGEPVPTLKTEQGKPAKAAPATAGTVPPPAPTVDPEKNANRAPTGPTTPQTYSGTQLPTPAPTTAPAAPPAAPKVLTSVAQAKGAEGTDEMLFGVQVGAFGKADNAQRLSERLVEEGFENVRVVRIGQVSRVFAGLFYFPNQAEEYKAALRERGHAGATVRRVQ